MRAKGKGGGEKALERIDVPVDVFMCGVEVWVGDPALMVRRLKADGRPVGDGLLDWIGDAEGAAFSLKGETRSVIWLRALRAPELAHEAVHVAQAICEERGVKDGETLCYLVGHIVRSVLGTEAKQVKKEKRR